MFSGVTDGRQDSRRARGIQRSFALQHAPQIFAFHELHYQIGAAIGKRAEVEDRHDTRVLQPRDDLRLATEAPPRIHVLEQIRSHDLHRDKAIEPYIARAIDGAHAAAADQLFDPVLVIDDAWHRTHRLER